MEDKNLVCAECLYALKNPICTDCFLREIDAWLKDNGMVSFCREIVLSRIKEMTEFQSFNEEKCILCKEQIPVLCAYCYFLKAALSLKEINFTDKELENFLEIFNYRHYMNDYVLS